MFSNAARARPWVGYFLRGVALLLLLTCVDILSPETCAEELLGFPAAAFVKAATADRDEPLAGSIHSETSRTGEDSESDHPGEDCFCCCSHLIVRTHFRLEAEPPDSITSPPQWLSLPASPPHSLYRPPRSL
jgi:hypothetical protein